jgi:hypothetical protein
MKKNNKKMWIWIGILLALILITAIIILVQTKTIFKSPRYEPIGGYPGGGKGYPGGGWPSWPCCSSTSINSTSPGGTNCDPGC